MLEPSTEDEKDTYFQDKTEIDKELVLTPSYSDDPTLFNNKIANKYVMPFSDFTFFKISSVDKIGDDLYKIKVNNTPTDLGVNVTGDKIFNEKVTPASKESTGAELKTYFASKTKARDGLILGVSYIADKTLFGKRKPTTVTYVREGEGATFYTFYTISEIVESGINTNKDVIYNVKVTNDSNDNGVNVLGDRIYDEKNK